LVFSRRVLLSLSKGGLQLGHAVECRLGAVLLLARGALLRS